MSGRAGVAIIVATLLGWFAHAAIMVWPELPAALIMMLVTILLWQYVNRGRTASDAVGQSRTPPDDRDATP